MPHFGMLALQALSLLGKSFHLCRATKLDEGKMLSAFEKGNVKFDPNS